LCCKKAQKAELKKTSDRHRTNETPKNEEPRRRARKINVRAEVVRASIWKPGYTKTRS
jgi:hypothetical protein